MSEQSTERDGQAQGQRRGQGKKILGLPRGQAIGLGLVALGGLAFLLWRPRKNAKAAQQQQSTAGTCPDGSTPDGNGNCPQNSQDWSGAIGTLQSEIADLQGAMAAGGSAGGGGIGAGGGTGTGDGTGTGAGSVGAAAGTTTAPPTASPVTAGPAPSRQAAAGPVANLRITSRGTTGFAAAWDAAKGATGYQYIVRDLATHQQIGSPHDTQGTIAVVSGLKSKTDYNLGVQALPGGPGANTHVRTK